MTTRVSATVYLIHFEKPYRHARHYVGYTALESVDERVERHRNGRGSRLLQVVTEAGINWKVVRVWEFSDVAAAKKKEKSIKKRASTRHCPRCTVTRSSHEGI